MLKGLKKLAVKKKKKKTLCGVNNNRKSAAKDGIFCDFEVMLINICICFVVGELRICTKCYLIFNTKLSENVGIYRQFPTAFGCRS